jgi:lincosamide nucleotidyltransferase A/C/D/E
MTGQDVITVIQLLEQNGIDVHIDGGWAVDSLLGHQARPHGDLDIAVPHDAVPRLRLVLRTLGYDEIDRPDTRDCNFVLADGKGREVDVHSYAFDARGNNSYGVGYVRHDLTGRGTIDGYAVKCVSVESLIKFHSGYELQEKDYQDVRALCGRYGIPLPAEYARFSRVTNVAAVVLDMDGVIVDTEPVIKRCIQQAASDLGGQIDDEFYARFVGRGTRDFDAALMERFGSSFPLIQMNEISTRNIRAAFTTDGIPAKPGLSDLLDLLDQRHIPVAVATSTDEEDAHWCLRSAGIWDRFRIVVTGDQVAKGKPEPDIYLEAAARLRVPAPECVAVEDSNAGVLAAARAGMRTFMVPDVGRMPSEEARQAAFDVVPSLHDVTAFIKGVVERS